MIKGLNTFKQHFKGFENQYVIIGGTACNLIMTEYELPFRMTKDIDIVFIVESLTVEFGKCFWNFIKEADYDHMNKSTGEQQFYRFTSPKNNEYPFMIEIFSRNPNFITLDDDTVLTPLPIDDEISSLSAILLNESYYEFLKSGRIIVDGISVLDPVCLIPFKARAWLDLKSRKENGEHVDGKNIRKHKNDIFRLAQLITLDTHKEMTKDIENDMNKFLLCMKNEEVDMKSLGIKGMSKDMIIQVLKRCYGLEKN